MESGLRDLGRLLFETVFRAGAEAENIWASVVSADGMGSTLTVISARPEFLALPWELLNSPDAGYVVSRAEGVVRQFVATSDLPSLSSSGLPDAQFNVLMLCPPSSPGIATQAIEAMESLELEVSLDRVTPATVEGLEAHLESLPGHYHLVHLDAVTVESGGNGLAGAGSLERIAEIISGAGIPTALVTCDSPRLSHAVPAALLAGGVAEAAMMPLAAGGIGQKAVLRRILRCNGARSRRGGSGCSGPAGVDAAPPPSVCRRAAGFLGLDRPAGIPLRPV